MWRFWWLLILSWVYLEKLLLNKYVFWVVINTKPWEHCQHWKKKKFLPFCCQENGKTCKFKSDYQNRCSHFVSRWCKNVHSDPLSEFPAVMVSRSLVFLWSCFLLASPYASASCYKGQTGKYIKVCASHWAALMRFYSCILVKALFTKSDPSSVLMLCRR